MDHQDPRGGDWLGPAGAAGAHAGPGWRRAPGPGPARGLGPEHGIADAAYDSDAIRETIRESHGQACIRPNPTRKQTKRYDRQR